jgi:hypothetical protein
VRGVRLSRQRWSKALQAARRCPAELNLYLATLKDLSPEAKAMLRENVMPNVRTQTPTGLPEVPNAGAKPKPGNAPKPAKPEGAKPKQPKHSLVKKTLKTGSMIDSNLQTSNLVSKIIVEVFLLI